MYHGIPTRDAARFEREMRYLSRHYRVVPLGEAVGALASDAATVPQAVLTFDDGLRNNVAVAYPILRALRLPATFFVCPGLVDEGRWLWNHEARRRLRRLDAAARARLALDNGAPASGIEDFIAWMKLLPAGTREEVEARIRAATPQFAPTPEEKDEFDLASWEDLRGLDPGLVTIGSHTLTHPILPSLSPQACEREIAESRGALEGKLQRTVDLFAYPNGDLDSTALACARRHYRAAVTTEPGWAAGGCDPHLIPRGSPPAGALRLAYFLATPMSVSGSQVASSGNTVMRAMQSTIMKKKGSEASAT